MQELPKKITVSISSGTIVRAVLIILGVTALFFLSNVVLIVLTSIVLASFVESMVKKLNKFKFPRTLSVFLVYLVTIGILAGVLYVFIPVLVDELSGLVVLLAKYFPASDIFSTFNTNNISGAKSIVNSFSTDIPLATLISKVQLFVSKISTGFLGAVSSAFGGVINLILIFVISFYLSIQERGVENFLRIVVPLKHEEYAIDLWRRTERKIGLWVQGQLLLGLFIGVLTYLGLTIIGVQYAFILAIIAGIFELIPFGIVLATIPAVGFAYIDGGLTLGAITAGFYIILQQFENYLIAPLVVKKVIGISPLVVILSVLIGSTLAGFWGLILAIPCAVFVFEFLDDIEKKKVFAKENEQQR